MNPGEELLIIYHLSSETKDMIFAPPAFMGVSVMDRRSYREVSSFISINHGSFGESGASPHGPLAISESSGPKLFLKPKQPVIKSFSLIRSNFGFGGGDFQKLMVTAKLQ